MKNYDKFIQLSPKEMAIFLAKEALMLMENPPPDGMTKQECGEVLAKHYYNFFMYDKEEAERKKQKEARNAQDKLIKEQCQRAEREGRSKIQQKEARMAEARRIQNTRHVLIWSGLGY